MKRQDAKSSAELSALSLRGELLLLATQLLPLPQNNTPIALRSLLPVL